MYGTLYSDEFDASLEAQSRRPKPAPTDPGWFTGFGEGVSEAPQNAWYSSLSALSETKDAVMRTWQMQDNTSMKLPNYKATIVEPIGRNEQAKIYREKAAQHLPDPATVGKAGQLAHGVTSALIKAGVYSLADAATLGIGGPALFGADMGMGRTLELTDKGVDPATALESGAVTGALNAAGMKLPAALGKTRLQSVAAGAGANAAMAVGENAAIHTILQHADYERIAAQYQPFDAENMIVFGLLGGAFGAAFHKAPGRALTADQHAAVLTIHEVGVRDGDALTPVGDTVAANQAREAQLTARQQIDSGEPVSVDVQADPVQVAGVVSAVAERNAAAQQPIQKNDFHPGISGMAAQLQEGGGIAYTFDEFGKINGRTPSVNPEWYRDGSFKIQGRTGDELATTPSVKEIKQAVYRYEKGDELTDRQSRILQSLSDVAAHEESLANNHFSDEQASLARELHSLITEARAVGIGHEVESAIARGDLKTHDDILVWRDDIYDLIRERNAASAGAYSEPFQDSSGTGYAAEAAQSAETRFSPETPEQAKALEYFQRNPDAIIPIEGANGDEHMHIQQLFQESQDIIDTAQKDFAGFQAAIECAMRMA